MARPDPLLIYVRLKLDSENYREWSYMRLVAWVLQGLNLGPVLFSVFINYQVTGIKYTVREFVDDTRMSCGLLGVKSLTETSG